MNRLQNDILKLTLKHGTDVLSAAETIIREKEARIARLTSYLCDLTAESITAEVLDEIRELINESPQQSLAAIQTDAVYDFSGILRTKIYESQESLPVIHKIEEVQADYVQQLRDKAEGK